MAQKRRDYYEVRAKPSTSRVGKHVWLYTPAIQLGESAKFKRPWLGPYKITKRLSDVVYRIEGHDGNFSREVLADRFKKHYERRLGAAQDSESSTSEDDSDLEVYMSTCRK